jgi:hypothetical protein
MCDSDDAGELPSAEEIADVTGGDVGKIQDGMRAFEWVGDEGPSASENIGSDCGGCVDNWPPSRDYSGRRWFWFQQKKESAGESEE